MEEGGSLGGVGPVVVNGADSALIVDIPTDEAEDPAAWPVKARGGFPGVNSPVAVAPTRGVEAENKLGNEAVSPGGGNGADGGRGVNGADEASRVNGADSGLEGNGADGDGWEVSAGTSLSSGLATPA